MIDSSSFRFRRLFLCTFIDCLVMVMVLFFFLFLSDFILHFYLRVSFFYLRNVFLFVAVRVGFGIGGSCSFVYGSFSKNGFGFYFSFHAVVMVALI